MKATTRVERKKELTELYEALKTLQDYCIKYDTDSIEEDIGYGYGLNCSHGVPMLKKKMETLDTPGKISDFLEAMSCYISSIYYREENEG